MIVITGSDVDVLVCARLASHVTKYDVVRLKCSSKSDLNDTGALLYLYQNQCTYKIPMHFPLSNS
jgi:hypothetical protein